MKRAAGTGNLALRSTGRILVTASAWPTASPTTAAASKPPLDRSLPTAQRAARRLGQILSVELRRRLVGSLTGAFFVDTGNTVLDHNDYLDFDDFRTGIGVGLRYMLPIGPLRIDGAVNPEAGPGEDDYVIHLSVGMAF